MKPAPKYIPSASAPAVSPRQGHDEMNFAEFPLVLLAKRAPTGINSIEYRDDYTDAKGKLITRKVTISGAGKYGLPTPHDEDVLIALIYLTLLDKKNLQQDDENNRPEPADKRTIHFTRPQLFQILGWPDTGDNYERLKKSLRRWKGVTIVYENWTFLTSTGDRLRTDETGFSLLDNYELADSRRRPKEPPAPILPFLDLPCQRSLCSITWNRTPFASFKSGYLKTLDLNKYFCLPTAAAKRAFRYLDKNLPPTGVHEYDLERFACQHVGFSTNYKPSRLRQDVHETVVRPLEQEHFIEPMPTDKRFHKREGRYRVIFARAGQPAISSPTTIPSQQPALSSAGSNSLLKELKRHHVGGKAAQDFVDAFPAPYIEQKIDYLEFLIETHHAPNKPAAWLRRAIEEDYGPPAGYMARADRLRQQEATKDMRRLREEEQASRRRQEEEETAARKAQRSQIDAYLHALTPPERKALEDQAVANADDSVRAGVQEGGPLANVFLRIALDQEVLRLHPFPVPRSDSR